MRFRRPVPREVKEARRQRKIAAIRAGAHVPGDLGHAVGPTMTTKTQLCTQDGCFNPIPCEVHKPASNSDY